MRFSDADARAASLALLILWPFAGLAQEPPPADPAHFTGQWRFTTSHDSLDVGDDWNEVAISRKRDGEGRSFYWSLRHASRFGEEDTEVGAAFQTVLSPQWQLLVDGTLAPSAEVLARASATVELARRFESDWVVRGGVGSSKYDNDTVDLLRLGAGRSFGAFSAAYTFVATRLVGESSNAHAVEADYSYGFDSRVGLQYITGDEAVRVSVGQVVSSDIDALSLRGLHWYAPQWGLTYSAGEWEQGDFYTRKGIQLGLAYRF